MLRRKRLLLAIATIIMIPVVAVGWWFLSPLFINKTVDEELPFAVSGTVPIDMASAEEANESAPDPMAMMDNDEATEEMSDPMAMDIASDSAMSDDKPDAMSVEDTSTETMTANTPSEAMPMDKSSGQSMNEAASDSMEMEPYNDAMTEGASESMTMDKSESPIMVEDTAEATAMEKAADETMSDEPADAIKMDGTDGAGDESMSESTAMEQTSDEATGDTTSEMVMQPSAVRLSVGDFRDADNFHRGSGQAIIYRGPDGSHLLRLEDFNVTNGPDLHVILTPHQNPTRSNHVSADGYVDLGMLKGNVGNQNYTIPGEVDVSAFGSVVIYCQPFHVIFSVATLQDTG